MNAFATPQMIQQAYKIIGIVYDKTLKTKFPDIDKSNYLNNENKCTNCNEAFHTNSYTDDNQPDSLSCGHSFCVGCWKTYLKSQIDLDESNFFNVNKLAQTNALNVKCVFARCI